MSGNRELVFARIGHFADKAILPRKGSPGAAAYDLYAAENVTLFGDRQMTVPVSTGWSVRVPPGKFLWIAERSGLALKGVSVGGGIIDSDYSGEVKVLLRYHSPSPGLHHRINVGDRVAQAILIDCHNDFVPVEVENLPALSDELSQRGTGGFGSTGL